MDLNGDGGIDISEFKQVVNAINDLLEFPLNDIFIEKLHEVQEVIRTSHIAVY